MGVSATYFERLVAALSRYGPVHSLDLPGFGGVPHPQTSMAIAQYADLVEESITVLGLTDPVLVGHSMGAQVVADLAARRPDLTALVLIGPVVNAAERTGPRQVLRFLQTARREPLRVKVVALTAYLLCGMRWFKVVLPEMMRYRLEDELPRIHAHTLVVYGEFDANCPPDWADTVVGLLPHAQAWEVRDAAHSVIVAHARAIARLCADHAHRQLPPISTHRRQHLSAEAEPEPSLPAKLRTFVRGRGTELLGILRGDDQLIARGKSVHAATFHRADP
jgi:pimeloyl-ACP methyl ester carboxylesterase